MLLCCVVYCQHTWAVRATLRWSLPRKSKPSQSRPRRKRRKCHRRSWRNRRWWWGNNSMENRTVKCRVTYLHCWALCLHVAVCCFIESLSLKLVGVEEFVKSFWFSVYVHYKLHSLLMGIKQLECIWKAEIKITSKCGNYNDVLPLKAARRNSIFNLTSSGASNLSFRWTQCHFI